MKEKLNRNPSKPRLHNAIHYDFYSPRQKIREQGNAKGGESDPNHARVHGSAGLKPSCDRSCISATFERCRSRRNSVAVVARLLETQAFHVIVLGGYALHDIETEPVCRALCLN